MMAIPLVVLYEISVMAVWAFGRKGFSGFDDSPQSSKDTLDIK
jgi:Sec-independent protein secretion pathway component TatC